MRWRRIALWTTLSGLVAAGVVYALWPRPTLVDIAAVSRGRLVVTVDEEGRTRVRDVFVVSSPITGRLRRVEGDVGDTVVADATIVASIEPVDPAFLDVRSEAEAQAAIETAQAAKALTEARLLEAQAELDFAVTELQRARGLIETRAFSERALDQAERLFKARAAALESVRAELQMRTSELTMARARLVSPVDTRLQREACECISLTAPVDGRILRLIRESEGVIEAGAPIMEIGDPRDLEIVVDYLSTDAVKIEEGQRAIIEEWGAGVALAGFVSRVEPYGFTKVSALGIEEQRVNVIVDLADPPEQWQRLAHGFRVEVRVVLWEGEEVLRLPLTTLFRENGRWFVFVDEDGIARRREVELGHSNGLEGEIVGGLTAGERVVLHPSDRIADGARIRARS